MALILVRIDDRLVHGQVVEGWLPFVDAQEVMVVSDVLAQDKTRKALMRLSLPEETELKCIGVKEAAEYVKTIPDEKRTALLAPSPAEIVRLIKEGVKFQTVNVGGLHYSVGKIQIGKAIFLSEEDIANLKYIDAAGIHLEGRGVPTDAPLNIIEMLDRQ